MLGNVVRKLLRHVGLTELSENDVMSFIRVTGLDKLPPHIIFLLVSIMPIIELVVKRLQNQEIDFGDLIDLK
jgi:hypothetical protein